jgi:hypothetical protein
MPAQIAGQLPNHSDKGFSAELEALDRRRRSTTAQNRLGKEMGHTAGYCCMALLAVPVRQLKSEF